MCLWLSGWYKPRTWRSPRENSREVSNRNLQSLFEFWFCRLPSHSANWSKHSICCTIMSVHRTEIWLTSLYTGFQWWWRYFPPHFERNKVRAINRTTQLIFVGGLRCLLEPLSTQPEMSFIWDYCSAKIWIFCAIVDVRSQHLTSDQTYVQLKGYNNVQ